VCFQLVHDDRILLVGLRSGGFNILGEERLDGTFDGDGTASVDSAVGCIAGAGEVVVAH
jgi:hypothetical protein